MRPRSPLIFNFFFTLFYREFYNLNFTFTHAICIVYICDHACSNLSIIIIILIFSNGYVILSIFLLHTWVVLGLEHKLVLDILSRP